MMLDALLQFDSAAAITVTRDSTNVLDMGVARDMGIGGDEGEPLTVIAQVDTTFTAGGAATLDIDLQGSADNITYNSYAKIAAIAVAALVQGVQAFRMKLPPVNPDSGVMPRYYKLVYTVGTGPMTAGKMTAYLAGTIPGNKGGYPRGFSANN